MANERSLAVGVSFLGYGDPGDGVPASIYTQCPIVHEGSVAFNFNEATSVDFRAEWMKDPWESFDKAGDPDSFEFAIPSPTAQEMLAFCGGSVSVLVFFGIFPASIEVAPYSPRALANVKTVPDAIPGPAAGTTTFQKILISGIPSVRAA